MTIWSKQISTHVCCSRHSRSGLPLYSGTQYVPVLRSARNRAEQLAAPLIWKSFCGFAAAESRIFAHFGRRRSRWNHTHLTARRASPYAAQNTVHAPALTRPTEAASPMFRGHYPIKIAMIASTFPVSTSMIWALTTIRRFDLTMPRTPQLPVPGMSNDSIDDGISA